MDGALGIYEGFKNVLVGGADEEEDAIYNMKERLSNEKIHLTCGSSFFILSKEKTDQQSIRLVDVGSFGLINDHSGMISEFLHSNNLTENEIDLVLYANSEEKKTKELAMIFGQNKLFDYQKLTGTYYTNSAFAMHYGIDVLSHDDHPVFGEGIRKVLVCNNLIPENLGLILLDKKNDQVETHK
jgi:hypothetical protein